MKKATALVSCRDLNATLRMLEYAHRLSPTDGTISLAMAVVRLVLGDPRAVESLERLTRHSTWRDLWMALILVRLRSGNTERAAGDLQTMLSRIAAPCSLADIKLATTVSRRADVDGWCGLDNTGRVTIAIRQRALRDLELLLDGTNVPCSELPRSGSVRQFRLPKHWPKATRLEVLLRGRRLIGSPIDITRIAQVEGFVETASTSGALQGWCRFPAEREVVPTITVTSIGDPRRRLSVRAGPTETRAVGGDQFALLHRFSVQADRIAALGDLLRITGPHGRTLYGSPIRPRSFEQTARTAMLTVAQRFPLYREAAKRPAPVLPVEFSVPVAAAAPPRLKASAKRRPTRSARIDIVIPAYRGKDATLACLASVFAHRALGERVIVVADGSPDRDLVAALSALAGQGEIVLHVEAVNRGFPIAANIGLRLAAGHDAVLLNSDTIVTPGWLSGLRAAIHSAPDIGTATPLSNDATILSYPRRDGPNPCPDAASAAELASQAAAANQGSIVEVPTGHAFCLYIRAECLQETGVLREDLFAQGYGEENDFCMRARHLGWRHVAVPGVFVAHQGGGSFNAARDDLMRRNLAILNQLHAGYSDMIARWHRQDPLAESRRRIDLARLQSSALGRDAVLMVTHDRDGGVRRHIAERLDVIADSGRRALLLFPEHPVTAGGEAAAYVARVEVGFGDEYPNLVFHMPDERDCLLSYLQACRVREIEVHSLIGHGDSVIDLLFGLAAPLHLIIHDYSWFCPRITLVSGDHRYCGEPGIAACRDCIADHGAAFEPASPDALVARTHRLIERARSVIAPSSDAAQRIERHFGREVVVAHWEEQRRFTLRPVSEEAGRSRPMRVCVVGAISYEKGYNNLLQCARLAATEKLPVEFMVVGHTCDDRRLLETGVVRITGRYDQTEAVALIEAQQADIAWLPSIWPETWCYVLTEIWQAGLRVVVYDIGSQAERVRAMGGGVVVPLDATAADLLAHFSGSNSDRWKSPVLRH